MESLVAVFSSLLESHLLVAPCTSSGVLAVTLRAFCCILSCVLTLLEFRCVSLWSVQIVPNFGRMLRPFFFLIKTVNVRQIGTSIIRSIPQILDVVFLLVLTVLMFSLVGYLIFAGVIGRHAPTASIFNDLRT